jgi:hypothetical protein
MHCMSSSRPEASAQASHQPGMEGQHDCTHTHTPNQYSAKIAVLAACFPPAPCGLEGLIVDPLDRRGKTIMDALPARRKGMPVSLHEHNKIMPVSPHWGLNPGPSVYKTDALPLSYRGY